MSNKMTKRKMRYFFHDDRLYKTLYVNRPADFIYAWDYEGRRRVQFVYSYIKKAHERAFTTKEVGSMMGRTRMALMNYISAGEIRRPPMSYALDGTFRPHKYLWRKKDVYELHDYLLTVHFGRPRKDGQVRPYGIPTKAELRAMMDHETIYYVKNQEGKMVKVFKEPDW